MLHARGSVPIGAPPDRPGGRRARGLCRAAAVVLLAALPAAAPAGGTGPEPAQTEVQQMQELSGHWQVTEIADADLPAHAVITIDIENGEMRGQAACGRYRVALQVDGDRLNMGEIRRTEADCEYALEVAERDFIGVLEVSDRFEIGADGGLTLLAQVTPMIRARPREP